MVISWGHSGDAQKGKEVFLFRANEVGSQGFGRLEAKRLFADVFEFCEELFFDAFGGWLQDIAGFNFLADVAGSGAEVPDAASEGINVFVFLSLWQERMFTGSWGRT